MGRLHGGRDEESKAVCPCLAQWADQRDNHLEGLRRRVNDGIEHLHPNRYRYGGAREFQLVGSGERRDGGGFAAGLSMVGGVGCDGIPARGQRGGIVERLVGGSHG